jgi:glycosyltransferase involved in cell wall biosynthesis
MKVLHLASGNRWTGAAAPAFAETVALREAGVDAHFAYVGGYKLEEKIGHHDFAHALIAKAQNPITFRRTGDALARLVEHHRFEVVHAHLTWDHWLARFTARDYGARLARTFHARRALRSDLFTRSLIRASDSLFVVNASFIGAEPIRRRHPVFTPPPLDTKQFTPEGDNMRAAYGIAGDALVVLAIGKIAPGRGFEEVLQTFALIRREVTTARLMIVGHGPHRPALEQLAARLGIDPIWAGYHEDDLAEHYRAADLLLFSAAGSDEGHRAILEAMACGVIPITFPIAGVPELLGDLTPKLVAREASAASAAASALDVIRGNAAALRIRVWERSGEFAYARAAERLMRGYNAVL